MFCILCGKQSLSSTAQLVWFEFRVAETTLSVFMLTYLAHHEHGLGILDNQLIAGVDGGAIKRLAACAPFLAEVG